jgi:serine/threonine protein kinase
MTIGQANTASATAPPIVRHGQGVPVSERMPIVGQWQLTAFAGAGQWTRVYRARPALAADDRAGDFAVKLLAPEYAADPLARSLLKREAQISRRVQHAQLATVLADHSAAETPHLVLPFLEGVSLESVVGIRRVSLGVALLIVRQVAEALEALHRAGWLHGDVKPGNVRVGTTGHATLLDLGLARQLGSEACSARYALATTLAYAAPESFSEGEWLSGAADIYSLGVVLYELLAGGPPFVGDAVQLIDRHRRETAADIRSLRPDISDELAELVRLLLAKEPLRRPETGPLVRMLVEHEILAIRSN